MGSLSEIDFAQPVGFRPLSLDLRTPDDQGGAVAPLIVFVHGGGWRIGSRKMFCPSMVDDDPFERIVAAGFAVASVEYRLSAEAVFPAQTEDVAAALGWLRAHGDRYDYDPSRVVLWGESAGATLAALVGLQDAAVRGIIDWYGPSDLPAMGAQLGNADDPASREAQWLGASAGADPERARAASPVAHVVAGAPPFLIAHGLADEAVPFAQSELLAARLAEVGTPVELELVPGAGHMWHGDDVDRRGLLDRAIAFAHRATA
ncbi:alpha/beta hydrolase [Microbacterium pygmaeum]|uniref:Acetyl esterase/lipase n=1 Tax=Microbacterium pygmaeum TaxID=370764 RepID=A0A1G7VLK4_9MICO|nr:alpha/beta hydrolase [Microbacterium pygmaeum]SDG60448.1 Acetyl esterase/lipase [Microbacterium pygmaeum]